MNDPLESVRQITLLIRARVQETCALVFIGRMIDEGMISFLLERRDDIMEGEYI
jgi:hypothetical protein